MNYNILPVVEKAVFDVAAGPDAPTSYRDYCPNAKSLNALFASRFEM